MLLTSAGVRNETLKSALVGLVGRPLAAATVAVIPTAAIAAVGDHGWLVENLSRLHGLGWRGFQFVDLNALPAGLILERLSSADVIYVEGGNVYHLANSIIVNGLAEQMALLLESKVYVGVSAGSMIFTRNMSNRTGEVFGEQEELRILGETPARPPFGLYDWYLKPHMNSLDYPSRTPAWFKKAAAQVDFPVYALDDDSAVRIRGDKIDVVSVGEWRILNGRDAIAESASQEIPGLIGVISHQVHSWRNKMARMTAGGAARGRRAYGNAFWRGW
jgi:dipeptidase E